MKSIKSYRAFVMLSIDPRGRQSDEAPKLPYSSIADMAHVNVRWEEAVQERPMERAQLC